MCVIAGSKAKNSRDQHLNVLYGNNLRLEVDGCGFMEKHGILDGLVETVMDAWGLGLIIFQGLICSSGVG